MYSMKIIINHSQEITLPKCMYHIRNPNESLKDEIDELNRKISHQVMKFLKAPNSKMTELEQRQEVLIKKLDILYDRIKTISSYCNLTNGVESGRHEMGIITSAITAPDEAVLVVNPDNLPWYLNKVLKDSNAAVNLSWHIHSSVANEKVTKIKGFVNRLQVAGCQSKINFRLIFKSVSADSELKLTSLAVPIVGTVNILRYLSYVYPNTNPYRGDDFQMDSLLDICHILEKTPDKTKENLIKKLFSGSKDWIYENKFSVVDLAAYNVIKQSKNNIKYVPKTWFEKCDTMCV